LYLATNILKMSEDEFWKCTPKKLQALFNVYKKVNGTDDDKAYIDEIMF
jgi:hypothetical protein